MADQMGVIVPVEEFKRMQETNTMLQKKMEEQEMRTTEIHRFMTEAQVTQNKLLGEMKTMNRTNTVELQNMQKAHARDIQNISDTHMSAIKNMEAVIRAMVSDQTNDRKQREEERKAQEHKRQLHSKVNVLTSRLTKAKLIEKGRSLGFHGIRANGQTKADLVQIFHNHAEVLERNDMLPTYVSNAYF